MTKEALTVNTWVEAHSYLKNSAEFHANLENILNSINISEPDAPDWYSYAEEIKSGAPLLNIPNLNTTVTHHAANLLAHLVSDISKSDFPENIRKDCAELDQYIRQSPEAALSIIKAASSVSETAGPALSGTARFLAHCAIERTIRPWRSGLESWLLESGWNRPTCPLCGEKPAMAQLVHTNNGHQRFLSCGCCKTRWKFMRLECPFCNNNDQDLLEILEPENSEDLRLDVCRQCNSYIKTYTNEGQEALMLSDWSTLHLDVVASGQGLQRRAHSLCELQ